MPQIVIEDITKSFEDSIAIKNISFTLDDGKLITLLGPSGSGKTTILRLIAGLIQPDKGKILVDNEDISEIPTEKRNIGFVFQSYALFPHLSVAENIAFGLETRKWSKEQITNRVKEMLKLVGLGGKGKRYPRELSGGEQSRVAVARALAPNPDLLLLDEPLSALDQSLKESLRHKLREIQQEVKVSTIYVTHDQTEAMEISDEIILLNKGEIVEIGTPKSLYLQPKKRFTAEFLGISNIIAGQLTKKDGENFFNCFLGNLLLPKYKLLNNTGEISIAIFPELINLHETTKGLENEFLGTITKVSFGGAKTTYLIEINQNVLEVIDISSNTKKIYSVGDNIVLEIPLNSIHILLED